MRRIRFGRMRGRYIKSEKRRERGHPKSVLITERVGEEIIFGVSCWNKKMDKWNRKEGKDKATERLELALLLPADAFVPVEGFEGVRIYPNNFFGRCPVDKALNMIEYFHDITHTKREKVVAK